MRRYDQTFFLIYQSSYLCMSFILLSKPVKGWLLCQLTLLCQGNTVTTRPGLLSSVPVSFVHVTRSFFTVVLFCECFCGFFWKTKNPCLIEPSALDVLNVPQSVCLE